VFINNKFLGLSQGLPAAGLPGLPGLGLLDFWTSKSLELLIVLQQCKFIV
jgi:hypothetical protein